MPSVLDLCTKLPLRTFPAGETLLDEGQTSGVLFVLVEGSVEIVKGPLQITTVSDPGAFFGEMSVLLGQPHMATVRTLQPSSFRVAADPGVFLGSHPEIAFAVARLLAKRLHFVTTYLVDLKRQFEGSGDHLAIVDEVLESLVHHQEAESEPGSDRYPDKTVD
jgi:CRP/FNR family transcriptional regulator, cyclic AMP receptor protein